MLEPLHIIIDSREQAPWAWSSADATTEIRGLTAGDYALASDCEVVKGRESLAVRFAIERKSLDDFLGTIAGGWDRFQRELVRMEAFPARVVIVEGDFATCCFGDKCRWEYSTQLEGNIVVCTTECGHMDVSFQDKLTRYCGHCGKLILWPTTDQVKDSAIISPNHNHPGLEPIFVARRISELTMMGVSVLFAGNSQLAAGLAYRVFRRRVEVEAGL